LSTSYRFAQTCAIHCLQIYKLGRKGEFSPEVAVVNVASAHVSLGSVAWDAYTLTHQENQ